MIVGRAAVVCRMARVPAVLCGRFLIVSDGSGARLCPLSRMGSARAVHCTHARAEPVLRRREQGRSGLRRRGSHRGLQRGRPLLHGGLSGQSRHAGRHPAGVFAAQHGPGHSPAAFSVPDAGDALMLVLPPGHLIPDDAAFAACVEQTKPSGTGGRFVTFDIVPDHPESGYGDRQQGTPLSGAGSHVVARSRKTAPGAGAGHAGQGGSSRTAACSL